MRKIILFLLILCLTFPAYSVCADGATVSAGVVSGDCGDIVSVPIVLSGNTGFVSLGIEIGYDESALELVAVSQNPEVGGNSISSSKLSENPYNLNWYSVSDIDFNGSVAEFKFRILAESGSHAVTVDFYKGVDGSYSDGDDVNFDEDFNSLNLKYSNGKITVNEKGSIDIFVPNLPDLPDIPDAPDTPPETDNFQFTVSVTGRVRGFLIAALYNDSGIMQQSKMVLAEPKNQFSFNRDGSVIKVFWFDVGLKPIALPLIKKL